MIQLRHLHLLTVCSLTLCLPASGTARAAAQGADVAETQLAGEGPNVFKLRIGDYRALIDVDTSKRVLFVRHLDHRKRIYKKK